MTATNTQTKLVEMAKDVSYMRDKVDAIEKKLDRDYVTQDQLKLVIKEFEPTKTLSLWLLAIVAVETIGLLFYLIRELITT